MSSMSGDENELMENESVRRTRSGRALKTPVKKTPIKKPATRTTRARGKAVVETEAVEECTTVIEELEEDSAPGNGMQEFEQVLIESNEESASSAQFENSEEVIDPQEETQYDHLDQETQGVPELEAPPPPIVSNKTASTPISSTLRVKESVQMTEDESDVITLEDNSGDNVIQTQDDNPGDEGMNGGHVEENQINDINEVIDEMKSNEAMEEETDVTIQEQTDEPMEVNDTVQEVEEKDEKDAGDNDNNEEKIEEQAENPQPETEQEVDPTQVDEEGEKKEPDTEAVSEDEFPTEAAAKYLHDVEDVSDDDFSLETEAVSDEELPAAPPADLGETESVSEDELPPESEKKRKAAAKASEKTREKKVKVEAGTKRKLNAEGEYDPNSPTSETNEETPAKKAALATDTETEEKTETAPPSPKKKTLPELDKYWKAVIEDPSDFTGWTYLLQYVDQENDAEAAREAYSKFLERYPYCYGYWRKYADYEKKKGNPDNVQTLELGRRVGSVHARKYGFPFQQPSTSCGTHSALFVYELANYLIMISTIIKLFKKFIQMRLRNTVLLSLPLLSLFYELNYVFDNGLQAISLSVDLWLHYINHCKSIYEEDEEKMREQYERAIEACGLEFRSDRLWESYIKWETEGKRFSRVTALYDRLLCVPTLGYMTHFESFQEFVSVNSPNRILNVDDFLALRAEVKAMLKAEETPAAAPTDDAPPGEELPPHEAPPTDEETRAIREKIISSRRKMHKANVNAVAARWAFEEGIKRPYFHVKPLERCQLKNWKEYLDFEIEQKDEKRIIILFERCLIACALYDEFWLRFIRYLESLKGDNVEKIRDVYVRACEIHHPKKPNLHLQWATFEEGRNCFDKAATILENIDNVIPNMLQIAYRRINLERRRGDLEKACTLYESYISNSKNRTIANNIVVKYARFLCKFKNDIDKAVKVLLKAADKDKENPRLYLQLIDLGLQRNPVDTKEIIGYMDMFIEREHVDLEQRVLFAQRKVEFLEDFSSDINQVLQAHEQFQQCIKQAKERKKTKNEDSKIDSSPPKKIKTTDPSSAPPPPTANTQSTYQYSSGTSGTYPSQQQFQSGQYTNQSGYQQSYQQYPPPSDPNYANYQNWQYSQSGPQAYGPYNQWGSYNYY
ncbi:Similar to prpf39: Pre-mRNA-processing factor 39 (Danio rerio) [Cotesia congregata]|uniref:Similar to prpf39: Pre-mRNA-processing factor 39 (Danio rerio) n=1 Tax=Cotesia congregata TaxID=51543 RepID=A0A8J2MY78_COTCN|nr:Similar to prpf39: Pre-mRNA-processing factor 39 (Danio rerio) [Cotesia congregata]